MGDLQTARAARLATAFAASLLLYALTRNGLHVYMPQLQLAVLPVLAGATLTGRGIDAGAAVACALGMGAFVGPPWFAMDGAALELASRFAFAAALAAGGGAAAAGLGLLAERWVWFERAAVVVGVAIVCANLALTTEAYSHVPQPQFEQQSLTEYVTTSPVPYGYADDTGLYLRTYYLMRSGTGYYEAFRTAMLEDTGWLREPPGALGYRLPTVFWLWKLQPFGPLGIVYTLVALYVVAVSLITYGLAAWVRPALALVATTALAAYGLFFTTTQFFPWTEGWAVPFAIASVAFYLLAQRAGAHRGWLWSSAGAALLAVLVREHFVLLVLAGLLAAVRDRGVLAQRRWVPWGVVLAVFTLAFSAHALIALETQTGTALPLSELVARWLQGGPAFLFAAINYATDFLADSWPLPVTLVALGAVGIGTAPSKIRGFVALAAGVPAALFLVVGNQVRDLVTGELAAYWGAVFMPYLLISVPLAFRRLPGMAPSSHGRTDS